MKVGIFYGSTTGVTEIVAEQIARVFGSDDIEAKSIASTDVEELNNYELLLLGSSTWGDGELQDDWEGFIDSLSAVDFSNKKVGIFGVGDQCGWADTFVDAIGIIYEKLVSLGATVIGKCEDEEYSYENSRAVIDGRFVGLALDDNNQSEMTDKRVENWVSSLKSEMAN